jgi:tRNA nucleotidyltransferase/poly(A) polymerase
MRHMLSSLPEERVSNELLKVLKTPAPRRFFDTLRACKVLDVFFPELHNLIDVPAGPKEHHPETDSYEHTMIVLSNVDCDADEDRIIRGRLGALCHDFGKAKTAPELWPSHIGHDKAGEEITKRFLRRLNGVSMKKFGNFAIATAKFHMKLHWVRSMSLGKTATMLSNLIRAIGLDNIEVISAITKADGSDDRTVKFITKGSEAISKIRLPEKFRNRNHKDIANIITSIKADRLREIKEDLE